MSSSDVARIQAQVPQITPNTFGFSSLEVVIMGRYPHMGRFQIEGPADRRIALEAMNFTEKRARPPPPLESSSARGAVTCA